MIGKIRYNNVGKVFEKMRELKEAHLTGFVSVILARGIFQHMHSMSFNYALGL